MSCKKYGEYICADCFSKISFDTAFVCLVCNRQSFNGLTHPVCRNRYTIDGAFTSIAYKNIVKKLIYQFKYQPYISDLHHVLTDLFYEGIIQEEQLFKILQNDTIFVPIPLHSAKFKKRGYNQAKLLAEGLAAKYSLKSAEVLTRIKSTKSQFNLSRKDRLENIKGAFSLKKGAEGFVGNKTICLVDDVLTSGATFLEAANILKRAGAKNVYGLALAKDE